MLVEVHPGVGSFSVVRNDAAVWLMTFPVVGNDKAVWSFPSLVLI